MQEAAHEIDRSLSRRARARGRTDPPRVGARTRSSRRVEATSKVDAAGIPLDARGDDAWVGGDDRESGRARYQRAGERGVSTGHRGDKPGAGGDARRQRGQGARGPASDDGRASDEELAVTRIS